MEVRIRVNAVQVCVVGEEGFTQQGKVDVCRLNVDRYM